MQVELNLCLQLIDVVLCDLSLKQIENKSLKALLVFVPAALCEDTRSISCRYFPSCHLIKAYRDFYSSPFQTASAVGDALL